MERLHISESSWWLDSSLSTYLCHKLCNIVIVVGHNQLHQSGTSFTTVLVLGFTWDQFGRDKELSSVTVTSFKRGLSLLAFGDNENDISLL